MTFKEDQKSPLGLYSIGIAALFLLGFFLLVVFGAQNYRNAVAAQHANNDSRVLLSYVSTCIKGSDQTGCVRIREEDGNTVLVIADEESGYASRLYLSHGNLVEDYAETGAALDPVFTVEELTEGLLAVTTDAGRSLIRLRSQGGVL